MNLFRPFLSRSETLKIFAENHEKITLVSYLRFFVLTIKHQKLLRQFYALMNEAAAEVTASMIGVVEWPYINKQWDVQKRLETIASHYKITTEKKLSQQVFNDSEYKKLIEFGDDYSNTLIALDRPKWFIREGEAVINLFYENIRVASIAFTLAHDNNEVVAYVGAVQGIHDGINSKKSLEVYKILTKLFHGLRPKTLLLEVLKAYLHSFSVSKLYGVNEEQRHHLHKYFGNRYKGKNNKTAFNNDYNTFWLEHGGVSIIDTGFFQVPMQPAVRNLEKIPSKKRSQYKKRNILIESLGTLLVPAQSVSTQEL